MVCRCVLLVVGWVVDLVVVLVIGLVWLLCDWFGGLIAVVVGFALFAPVGWVCFGFDLAACLHLGGFCWFWVCWMLRFLVSWSLTVVLRALATSDLVCCLLGGACCVKLV